MWVSFPCRVPRGARGVKMECIDQEEIIGIKLMIENEVTQRLDALTDGTS